MKKIIFLSLLPFLLLENCLSTELLYPGEGFYGLHFRGKTGQLPEESFPLIVEEFVSQRNSSTTHVTEEEIDEDAIFSCLGDVWKAFKEKNFDGYFAKLVQLQLKESPEACYLLGMVHEKGVGRIAMTPKKASSYYTRVMASLQCDQLLYSMALRGLERCKEKRLERVLYYRR